LRQEMESLEEQLQIYLSSTDVVEAWLRENEGEKAKFSIDEVYQPLDKISCQLLECQQQMLPYRMFCIL
jgi:hypothetical protein